MDSPRSIHVRFFTSEAASAARWTRALESQGIVLRTEPPPEIIVADAAGQGGAKEERLPWVLLLADVAQVAWQTEPRVEIRLPAAATAAELALAIGLAAELGRLRQRLAGHDDERQRLAREARTDAITGLPNRRAWDEHVAAQSILRRRADDSAAAACLAIVDVDQFKAINDTHGHEMGDAVLRVIGAALRADLRNHDFVARVGGDEFGIWLPNVTPDSAARVLDRLRLEAAESLRGAGLPTVTLSLGFNVQATPSLSAADSALREAKRAGRNRVVGA